MNRIIAIVFAATVSLQAAGAWYWPFGGDDEAKRQPRVSELMEKASTLIDEASDLAADGKSQDAVVKYREALAELDRVELENPERAGSPEFATVRNKRAYVNAAIDSMLMREVKENAKAVAVSDTTELERRLAAEREGSGGRKGEDVKPEPSPGADKPDEPELKKASSAKRAKRTLKRGNSRNERIIEDIAAGEYEGAAIMIGEMLQEKPNGAAALNLKAALETAQGKYDQAEKTLDRAIMSNPRSHYAYYNMSRLILQTRTDGRKTARRYYETGRAVGGPEDPELEERTK